MSPERARRPGRRIEGPARLAIDLGASSGRGVLVWLAGDRLHSYEVHRFPNRPVRLAGHLRWDALALYAEIEQALALAREAAGEALTSVGVDTWAVDYALLDRRGQLLAPPYHYRDARTDGVMAAAVEKAGRRTIFRESGIQFLPFNTLYQLIAARRDEPEVLACAERLLMMGELFTFWLSGEAVAERTNASTTQFLQPGGEWSEALAEAFDLPLNLMAPLIEPAKELGPLLPEVAERVGTQLTVTAPTIHDTAAAVLATPADGDDWCYLSSGTWSLLGIEVESPILSPQALAANFTNESGIGGTFRFLKNVMGLWLLQECARAWGSTDFAGLVGAAVGVDPWQSLVDPDHPDFLAPADMPAAIQAYCRRTGQPVPDEPAAIVRCIMDSLALKYALVLEQLEQTAHRNVRRIHVVGGGSQNHFLNQLTADATGCEVVAGPVEATAIGNALAQMIAGGQLADHWAARALVGRSFELRRFAPRTTVPEAARVRLRELAAQAGA